MPSHLTPRVTPSEARRVERRRYPNYPTLDQSGFIAVFDANLYMELGTRRLSDLRALERTKGVTAMTNVFTVLELAGHAADPEDPDYDRCLAALRSIWEHCAVSDHASAYLPLLADWEGQLCLSVFGRDIPNRKRETEYYGTLVKRLASVTEPMSLDTLRAVLKGLQRFSARAKRHFADGLLSAITALDPRAEPWQVLRTDPERRRAALKFVNEGSGLRHLATTLLRHAAQLCVAPITDTELTAKADLVMEAFPTALHYYNDLIRKIIESGFNLSQGTRANALWDFQLACYASPTARVNELPVRLVTNDSAIRRAAEHAGSPQCVLALADYQRELQL